LIILYKAYEPGIKEKIVNIAINARGVRDTARVLGINIIEFNIDIYA